VSSIKSREDTMRRRVRRHGGLSFHRARHPFLVKRPTEGHAAVAPGHYTDQWFVANYSILDKDGECLVAYATLEDAERHYQELLKAAVREYAAWAWRKKDEQPTQGHVSQGIPELVEAMDSGKLSISAASELAGSHPDTQRRVLATVKDENG
jgi:hypothetical protein